MRTILVLVLFCFSVKIYGDTIIKEKNQLVIDTNTPESKRFMEVDTLNDIYSGEEVYFAPLFLAQVLFSNMASDKNIYKVSVRQNHGDYG